MYTLEYIPVDGNFEDGTTAILREIGQDSDSPDSDSGSEMELGSRASLVPSHSQSWPDFKILFQLNEFLSIILIIARI